jgi:hypothetical protein
MKAEITAPQGFRIAPEGHTVVTFEAGQIVTGKIAEEAILAGMARKIDEVAATLEYKAQEAEPVETQVEQTKRRGRPRKVS